jgi:hypothetical protein
MKTLTTLKQLIDTQRDLLTDDFWLGLCESQILKGSPLGNVLSNIEYHDGCYTTKNKRGLFVVGGDNGFREYEWQEVLEFARTSIYHRNDK